MKVTGYQIREAIKRWTLRRDTASKQFNDSLWQFKGEDSDPNFVPSTIAEYFDVADMNIALLETLQQAYNLRISFEVGGNMMTLSTAVKRVGGAGRLDKMWRSAATSNGTDRWGSRTMTRQQGEIAATRMVATGTALELADKAAAYAGKLRAAIAMANATVVETSELTKEKVDSSLFE